MAQPERTSKRRGTLPGLWRRQAELGLRRVTEGPGPHCSMEWTTGRPSSLGPSAGRFRDLTVAQQTPWRLHQVRGALHSSGHRGTVRVVTGITRMFRGERQVWLTRAQSRLKVPVRYGAPKGKVICCSGDLAIGLEDAYFLADPQPRKHHDPELLARLLPPWPATSEAYMLRQQIKVFGLKAHP